VGGLAGEIGSAGWFLPDGASGLVDYLATELAGDVLLNSPAAFVSVDRSGVSLRVHDETIRAGRAIIAIPPQLYRAAGLLPQLPETWRPLLADWRPGAVVKTILVYDLPWWRSRGFSGSVLAPDEVFSAAVDTSPALGGPGVLVVFSTARGARTLGETAHESARVAQAANWVRQCFGGEVPRLVTGRSINWSSDPHSLGGYASRRAPGGWAKVTDLFSPLGRLHFAGTETASSWRSFMEGAILSGLRAAEEVRMST
jgi:monoamine oxidase